MTWFQDHVGYPLSALKVSLKNRDKAVMDSVGSTT